MRALAAAADSGALFLILGFGVSSAGGAEVVPKAAPPPVPSSNGLLNDLLRKEFHGASAWDVGGEFRVRFEMKDNAGSFPNRDFAQNLDNSNDFFLFRTKLHLGWSPVNWFSAYLEGRDAYAASDSRPITETDTLDVHQAYLRLGDPKQLPISLKLGRQEMVYADQRYIGNSDWSNLQRSFDAVKLRFENKFVWIDAFSGRQVFPRDGHFNVVNRYDWFSGIYASTQMLAPWQDTDLYFIARNVGAKSPTAISPALGGPGKRDIYTLGTRWKSTSGAFGAWDYTLEVAGQFGNVRQGNQRLDHQAYAVNISGGYTWKSSFGTPRLGAGYDHGSGDRNPGDGKNETLELLFGTNHRVYGNMDLMGMRNMHIPRLEASIEPHANLTISLEWLAFWLADTADILYPEGGPGRIQNGYGRHPGFSSHVGQEVDLLVDWRLDTWGVVRAGYGHFFVGDYIRQSISSVPGNGGAVDADWVYLQTTLRF